MPTKRHTKKASRAAGRHSVPTPVDSSHTTPLSSALPSAYASEAENDSEDDFAKLPIHELTLSDPAGTTAAAALNEEHVDDKPFRFLDLPLELRIEIYMIHFDQGGDVIDLNYDNYKRIYKKLAILRTCKTIYTEASHVFYSLHTFRLFPTSPGRFSKTRKPLLARLNSRQRGMLTSLELRLGPGWSNPPRGWVVNPALGLSDCVNVRKLTVFVECDPSDSIFKGFRKADGFYETFSRNLLDDVLRGLPLLDCVHFDAWSSVKKSGPMMTGLFDVAAALGRRICWVPENEWSENGNEEKALTTSHRWMPLPQPVC
ncbi:hypothetical protein VTK26DRAFT_2586 [Humicola hyalothermophila]